MITKTVLSIILLAGVCFEASYCFADSGFYGGVSYSELDYSEPGLDLDFSTIGGLVGYKLSNTFAIEVRGAKGQTDDDIYGYGVEVDKTMSVFGRFSLANQSNITPYLLGGFSKGWLSADGGYKVDETDFSYGLGLAFSLTDELAVSAEYVSMLDTDDAEVNAASLLLTYDF